MSISALILDLDGVLIDTETVGRHAWHRAADEMGFAFPEDLYARLVGRPVENCREIIATVFPLDMNFEQYVERSNFIYHDEMQRNGIAVMDGVAELLNWIERTNLDAAIATSSSRETAEWKIEKAGLAGKIETLVTRDDVQRGKPAPDPFILSARLLRHPAEQCVVIEDSESGVTSAYHAGTIPIMVPSTIPASDTARSLSYSVVDSLPNALSIIENLHANQKSD